MLQRHIPPLRLLRCLECVLVLQFRNERLIQCQLFFGREVGRYGCREAPLLGCHAPPLLLDLTDV